MTYPQLPNILNENPLEPKDNRIVGNIFEGEPWLDPRGFKLAEAEHHGGDPVFRGHPLHGIVVV